jgi:hypothetical protein
MNGKLRYKKNSTSKLEPYKEPSVKQSRNNAITPNMIPCLPASNGTDAHHCDTIS